MKNIAIFHLIPVIVIFTAIKIIVYCIDEFCLGVFPCLQEYGNISYSIQDSSSTSISSGTISSKHSGSKKSMIDEQPRIVVPVISIETPD